MMVPLPDPSRLTSLPSRDSTTTTEIRTRLGYTAAIARSIAARSAVCAAAGAERRHTAIRIASSGFTVRKLSIKPLGKVNTVNTPCAWSLRIPGRRLDLEQLRGVTFGVAAEHQDELIGGRHLRRRPSAVLAQRILRRPHVLQRSSARRFEVLGRLGPGDDLAGRLELRGSLELLGTIANHLRDHGVACGGLLRRRQGGSLERSGNVVAEVLFGGNDVRGAFSDRPAVGRRLVIPLRFRLHVGNGVEE